MTDADAYLKNRYRSPRRQALAHIQRLERLVKFYERRQERFQELDIEDEEQKREMLGNNRAYRQTALWALALANDEVERKWGGLDD